MPVEDVLKRKTGVIVGQDVYDLCLFYLNVSDDA